MSHAIHFCFIIQTSLVLDSLTQISLCGNLAVELQYFLMYISAD